MKSKVSLRDGQSGNLQPPTGHTASRIIDETTPPPAPAGQVGPGSANLSVGGKHLLEGLLVALVPSSLGLVAYAILRGAYVWFYQRYGVAPEEVGLNQMRMLSSMLRFIHLWVWSIPGSPASNIVILLLGSAAMVGLCRRLVPRLRRRSRYVELMADRHRVLLGASVAIALLIFSFALALPLDRSFAGKRLQLGRAVRPAELAFLSIQADPARLTWVGPGQPPKEVLAAKLVYLGKADGVLVLYQPPDWGSCEVDSCRGATWKVRESDVVLRLEVNPPDQDAPMTSSPPTAAHKEEAWPFFRSR